jgi:hypothetical protein
VTSINGKTGDVSLTAADIGAQPAFEVGEGLQMADGVLSAVGGGGGAEGVYELIEETTLVEATSQLYRDAEPNGTPYRLKAVLVLLETADDTENFSASAWAWAQDTNIGRCSLGGGTGKMYAYFEVEPRYGAWHCRNAVFNSDPNRTTNFNNPYQAVAISTKDVPYIDVLRIYNLPAKTKVTIKGVRA